MKVLMQDAQHIVQENGLIGMYKHIEKAARTCYQSYKNIKDGSAERMVQGLIKLNHTAMLEHGTVYLVGKTDDENLQKYIDNKYTVSIENGAMLYITTNYRVIGENGWFDDMKKYGCDSPCPQHMKTYTIKMITNLQVAMECIRHRQMSMAMESSRYCAYDKEQFGDELAFIFPLWLDNEEKSQQVEWINGMQDAENHYMRCRMAGWTAERCAQFLPKAAKTTLVMTGFKDYWKHFFDLRYRETTGKVHEQMKELSTIIYGLIGEEVDL